MTKVFVCRFCAALVLGLGLFVMTNGTDRGVDAQSSLLAHAPLVKTTSLTRSQ